MQTDRQTENIMPSTYLLDDWRHKNVSCCVLIFPQTLFAALPMALATTNQLFKNKFIQTYYDNNNDHLTAFDPGQPG